MTISLNEQIVISFTNVRRMLGIRGVDTSALDGITSAELDALTDSTSVFTFVVLKDKLNLVYYNTKFKVAEFNSNMFGKQKDVTPMSRNVCYMFVFKDEISGQNSAHMNEFFPNNEVFWLKHTLYRPDMHVHTPAHRKLSDAEVADIMLRYQTDTKTVFPQIQKTDPMAKFVGLGVGDIVEITRKSPTSGTYLYYRVCV
jgi:DNA-directed RNA polymerase subunit H (RpoH/RPB5)